MAGDPAQDVRPRCQVYATYLARHLLWSLSASAMVPWRSCG